MFARYFYLLTAGFFLGLMVHAHSAGRDLLFTGSMACVVWALVFAAKAPGAVNVWAMQRKMMEASGQSLPPGPALNSAGVLYVALTAEELAEVLEAQLTAMVTHAVSYARDSDKRAWLLERAKELEPYVLALKNASTGLRRVCEGLQDLDIPLTLDQAVPIFDGVTDTMVTAAGLAPAHGLPAEEGYMIVQASNWSKTNPETGVIDKTPEGKWIKGKNYWKAEPRLRQALATGFYEEE